MRNSLDKNSKMHSKKTDKIKNYMEYVIKMGAYTILWANDTNLWTENEHKLKCIESNSQLAVQQSI